MRLLGKQASQSASSRSLMTDTQSSSRSLMGVMRPRRKPLRSTSVPSQDRLIELETQVGKQTEVIDGLLDEIRIRDDDIAAQREENQRCQMAHEQLQQNHATLQTHYQSLRTWSVSVNETFQTEASKLCTQYMELQTMYNELLADHTQLLQQKEQQHHQSPQQQRKQHKPHQQKRSTKKKKKKASADGFLGSFLSKNQQMAESNAKNFSSSSSIGSATATTMHSTAFLPPNNNSEVDSNDILKAFFTPEQIAESSNLASMAESIAEGSGSIDYATDDGVDDDLDNDIDNDIDNDLDNDLDNGNDFGTGAGANRSSTAPTNTSVCSGITLQSDAPSKHTVSMQTKSPRLPPLASSPTETPVSSDSDSEASRSYTLRDTSQDEGFDTAHRKTYTPTSSSSDDSSGNSFFSDNHREDVSQRDRLTPQPDPEDKPKKLRSNLSNRNLLPTSTHSLGRKSRSNSTTDHTPSTSKLNSLRSRRLQKEQSLTSLFGQISSSHGRETNELLSPQTVPGVLPSMTKKAIIEESLPL